MGEVDLCATVWVGDHSFSGSSVHTLLNIDRVRFIGYNAFFQTQLTEVDLGFDHTIDIRGGCFSHCAALTKLVLPKKMVRIPYRMCLRCTSLRYVVFPDTLEKIEDLAFVGCVQLSSLVFPPLKQIARGAFDSCGEFDLLDFSQTVVDSLPGFKDTTVKWLKLSFTIVDFSYFRTSNLKIEKLTLPPGYADQSTGAFINCVTLTELELSDGIQIIGEYMFNGCTSLERVRLPEGMRNISFSAFCDCHRLTDVKFPSTLGHIGKNAFKNCNLNTVDLSETRITSLRSSFSNCGITSIKLPSSLCQLWHRCLYRQPITELVIPNSVTQISYDSLRECRELHTLSLPASLTTYDRCLFDGCDSLKHVVFPKGVKFGTPIEADTDWRPRTVAYLGPPPVAYLFDNSILECMFSKDRSLHPYTELAFARSQYLSARTVLLDTDKEHLVVVILAFIHASGMRLPSELILYIFRSIPLRLLVEDSFIHHARRM